ncbi:MAG: tRNA (cytidine(34)-2'-O)-methyltransferase [Candidatus Marinamargulisbacteria bacterium]
MVNIVLVEPKIPQNTGTIARLCAATNAKLTLVGPLGFSLSDKYLKRAGLDYWEYVQWHHVPNTDVFFDQLDGRGRTPPFLLSSKATKQYTDMAYAPDATLIFGSETTGLPSHIKDRYASQLITIPMENKNIRSLNLANSVSIVLYEVIRQNR